VAGALEGIRVLDLSTRAAAAWCSRLLADFGADVVLVEPPSGHPLRQLAPFAGDGESITAAYLQANKRSVTLDVGTEVGREAIAQLAAQCDVVVESFAPGVTTGWLDHDALEARRPGTILVSVTANGQSGDRAGHAGNDLTSYALTGWASVNGLADREPLKGSGLIGSFVAGTAAYGAAVTALLHRELQGGPGQLVDVAETEALLSIFSAAFLHGQYTGAPFPRREAIDVYGSFPVPVADGHLALTIGFGDRWRHAMIALGLPELADDERWATRPRAERDPKLAERIQSRMLEWEKMELFESLAVMRVIAGPVFDMGELHENEQLRARDYFVRPPDAPEGPEFPGAPVKLIATPWSLRRSAPSPGEHTAEVLRDLAGYDDDQIAALAAGSGLEDATGSVAAGD
jgi:crotonobetainyl-CoA:carnitine CoA-transferase CaiB-like acyl-CoA transferase